MIKLIVLDVDGTLTDGKITYDNEGNELKSFNVKDGLGIAAWIKLGKQVAIITGRKSQIVENRAKELGITHIKQGISNKAKALYEILEQSQIQINEVAIIGDDLNDLSMFKIAKHTFAPKDSAKEIQKIAHTTLSKKGGKGAVREMIDILIKQENLEAKLYEIF
ncbi:KdsC family phosphatase [Helicobacter canadensis]|uniref:3-deoxy-D-manno-octulosonate 8-phosphate phosphatase KdsC n=1 Tax=Helicobacter canadensis MIT 98-5491 TaxID=537970 RepID=C5ZVW5_9HELI|nr:HAD-IIIA family hydrolase [Helicobacter canadensis]EES89046.1 putative phosphatase [Helicobacter canadensis MIT 98-5491]EFR49417.1 3-deoxy-manno-octulosonate-8-phosphatase [Helicobacter canadensis MIT 98-5491]STO99076.1 3-deoxy-D-manno-octulosonate 8-phosphate phosphatase [Helicobacter canadensis]